MVKNHKNSSSKLISSANNFFRKVNRYSVICIIGILFIFSGLLYLSQQNQDVSFTNNPNIDGKIGLSEQTPHMITIPAINLSIPVEDATVSQGKWQTFDKAAAHISTSADPGDPGNIVIYGHNTSEIFQNLIQVRLGEIIEITTRNGNKYAYTIAEIKTVSPQTIDVIRPTAFAALTVYTCTGFWDRQRLVIRAYPALSGSLN